MFKEISAGKEELKFLQQERQRKYLNISVPHASRGSAGQCFERDLSWFHIQPSPGLMIRWIEPYSRECAELETPPFHLEMLGLRVPLRLA